MLFRKNIEPCCVYCRFATGLGNDEYACSKRGIMYGFGSCGAFRYEPTKREPEPLPIFMRAMFTEEDFAI